MKKTERDTRDLKVIVKKTVYIEKDLELQIKLQAVKEEKTESNLLNEILSEYFTFRKKESQQ